MLNFCYDIETIVSCFVFCAEDYKTPVEREFVIHKDRNDLKELLKFLDDSKKNNQWFIGFNNLAFDGQVVQHILKNRSKLLKLDGDQAVRQIYKWSQDVIMRSNENRFQEFAPWKMSINQIDLFKLNHFDNPARSSSLKWIQYTMDWANMQEMPIHHTEEIEAMDIQTVIDYCKNDVKTTKALYHRSLGLLDVRKRVKAKYGLDCLSYSNTKMGSELLLKLYCEKTGQDKQEVKRYKTRRDRIIVSDILFPYIKFNTLEFQKFHEIVKNQVITNTKDGFKHTLKFKGYKFEYGSGGIHQTMQSGIYTEDKLFQIVDADVASLYPSIACVNKMYPAHLGPEFYEIYKNDIVDVRLDEKAKGKDGDKAIIDGYKEAANASYGLSNSSHSWLYDPQYTMQTTINGQLLLSMLAEILLTSLEDSQLLQTNTDGLSLRFKRVDIDKYKQICSDWEKITNLKLEFADYKAMYIWDINSYFAEYTNGKIKYKGRFEYDNLPLHKNKSFLIIPKAIFNYFVNNITPEQYLQDNRNIYDYCGGVRAKGDWKFRETCILPGGEISYRDLSKVIRYYVSTDGCKIVKHNHKDNRDIQVEAGPWMQTEFNKFYEVPWNEYYVNDKYYLDKIYKEIATLKPKQSNQLNLF